MDTYIDSGQIKPLKRNSSLVISHLLFADDMLVFCKGDKHSATGLINSLKQLELFTGLTMNKQKANYFLAKGVRTKRLSLIS